MADYIEHELQKAYCKSRIERILVELHHEDRISFEEKEAISASMEVIIGDPDVDDDTVKRGLRSLM